MELENQTYDLIRRVDEAPRKELTITHGSPDEPLVDTLFLRELLSTVSGMYEGRVVTLTRAGLEALERARKAGVTWIDQRQDHTRVTFHQTVHGQAYTQVGDHNAMTVQGQSPEQLLTQLQALRGLIVTLPEEDREAAANAIQSAEKAAQGGRFDRVTAHLQVLLTLATQGTQFYQLIKGLIGG